MASSMRDEFARSTLVRWATLLGLTGALVVGISGCGSAGGSSEVVVDVNGAKVTSAMFTHWLSVAAVRDYELTPSKPVPKWVIPDPPHFNECATHLPQILHQAPTPSLTASQRKAQCASRYRSLREQVLSGLITGEWYIAEGKRRGLTATDSEVRKRFERVRINLFGSVAAFNRYLHYSGETVADQMFRSRIKVYSEKIEHQLAPAGNPRAGKQTYPEFFRSFTRRWVARTNCSPGYVVPECRQYRGPLPARGSLL